MKITQRVKKILANYESDSPGTKANIARILMTGKLAGTGKEFTVGTDELEQTDTVLHRSTVVILAERWSGVNNARACTGCDKVCVDDKMMVTTFWSSEVEERLIASAE